MNKALTILTLLVTTSTSFADHKVSSSSSNFYFSIGGGFFSKNKFSQDFLPSQTIQTIIIQGPYIEQRPVDTGVGSSSINYKQKNWGQVFVGFGYRVSEKFRLEAVYIRPIISKSTHHFTKLSEERSITTSGTGIINLNNTLEYQSTISNKINALQARVYFDAFEIKDLAKFYVGGGAGMSQIFNSAFLTASRTREISLQSTGESLDRATSEQIKQKIAGKTQMSINYMFGVGVNFNIVDGITFGIGYELQNFGTLKAYKNDLYECGSKTFKSHAGVIRLIYDI